MIEHKNDIRNGFFKDNALKRHFLVISISATSVHLKLHHPGIKLLECPWVLIMTTGTVYFGGPTKILRSTELTCDYHNACNAILN